SPWSLNYTDWAGRYHRRRAGCLRAVERGVPVAGHARQEGTATGVSRARGIDYCERMRPRFTPGSLPEVALMAPVTFWRLTWPPPVARWPSISESRARISPPPVLRSALPRTPRTARLPPPV